MDKEKEILTKEQTWDVIRYAEKLAENYWKVLTPETVNRQIQDASLNPVEGTTESIGKALQNPKNAEMDLIAYNQFFELSNQIYKRTLSYLSNLLSFDLTWVCTNAWDEKDYKSVAYKKDYKRMVKFLDKFDYKKEFTRIAHQMLRDETCFTALRTEAKDKYILQELPYSYCMLTGKNEWTYNFSFNYYYFMQQGVNVKMFPKPMMNTFLELQKSKSTQYNPNNPNSTWAMWGNTDFREGFWAFKFNDTISTNVPFLSGMLQDVAQMPLFRELQKNKNIASAYKLIAGEIPLLDNQKGSNTADAFAVSPDSIAMFLALMKKGLPECFKMAGLPLSDIDQFGYEDKQPEMYTNALKTISAMSGVNARTIFAYDKMSESESRYSLNVDELLMQRVYSQFSNWLTYYVNQQMDRYYFKFNFEGSNMKEDRKWRLDQAMTLANVGIFLPQKISSAIGMNYADFERQLLQGKCSGIENNLTHLMSIHTTSGDTPPNNDKGRPPVDEHNDNGGVAKDYE